MINSLKLSRRWTTVNTVNRIEFSRFDDGIKALFSYLFLFPSVCRGGGASVNLPQLLICAIQRRAVIWCIIPHLFTPRTSHTGTENLRRETATFCHSKENHRGLGIAYEFPMNASPEIIDVHFWNFSFKFWITAWTGFWIVNR